MNRSIRASRTSACLFSTLFVPIAAGAVPGNLLLVPIGGEVAVTPAENDSEFQVRVAGDRLGGWTAAWHLQDREFVDVGGRLRRADRDGTFVPGSLRELPLKWPDVGLDGSGNGVVVGIRERPELGGAEVGAQCIDSEGQARAPLFRVDTGNISPQTRRPSGPRVAMDTTGEFFVAWSETPRVDVPSSIFARRFGSNCEPLGAARAVVATGDVARRELAIATRPEGGAVLTWVEGNSIPADLKLMAQQFAADGSELGAPFRVDDGQRFPRTPEVAVDGSGRIGFGWLEQTDGSVEPLVIELKVRVFDENGAALGPELGLREPSEAGVWEVGIAAIGDQFVAAWAEVGCFFVCGGVYARAFDAVGMLSAQTPVHEEFADPGAVKLAATGGNEFVVVWDDLNESDLPPDVRARRFALAVPGDTCVEGPGTLCLSNNRFRVEIEWRNFLGQRGAGRALDLTAESGLFWFFDEENLEVLVKMVDACAEFDRQWLFAAATTNVEYTIHVTDTQSGRTRSYFNPVGRSSPAITDTQAFADCP